MSSARCLSCANTSRTPRYHPSKAIFRGVLTLLFNSKSALRTDLRNAGLLCAFGFSIHSRYGRYFLRRLSVKLSCFGDAFLDVTLTAAPSSPWRESRPVKCEARG
jgi:hypothetical protein